MNVALGTFYVYFDSKETIFRARVDYMSHLTRAWIAERVGPTTGRADDAYRRYYTDFAEAYQRNLAATVAQGEIRDGKTKSWPGP